MEEKDGYSMAHLLTIPQDYGGSFEPPLVSVDKLRILVALTETSIF